MTYTMDGKEYRTLEDAVSQSSIEAAEYLRHHRRPLTTLVPTLARMVLAMAAEEQIIKNAIRAKKAQMMADLKGTQARTTVMEQVKDEVARQEDAIFDAVKVPPEMMQDASDAAWGKIQVTGDGESQS